MAAATDPPPVLKSMYKCTSWINLVKVRHSIAPLTTAQILLKLEDAPLARVQPTIDTLKALDPADLIIELEKLFIRKASFHDRLTAVTSIKMFEHESIMVYYDKIVSAVAEVLPDTVGTSGKNDRDNLLDALKALNQLRLGFFILGLTHVKRESIKLLHVTPTSMLQLANDIHTICPDTAILGGRPPNNNNFRRNSNGNRFTPQTPKSKFPISRFSSPRSTYDYDYPSTSQSTGPPPARWTREDSLRPITRRSYIEQSPKSSTYGPSQKKLLTIFNSDCLINVTFNNNSYRTLIDTGSAISFIKHSIIPWKVMSRNIQPVPSHVTFKTAGTDVLAPQFKIDTYIVNDNVRYYHTFYVLKTDLGQPILFGTDFLNKHINSIDFANNKVYWKSSQRSVRLIQQPSYSLHNMLESAPITEKHKKYCLTQLESLDHVFSKHKFDLGLTNLCEFEINLKSNKAFRKPPYRYSPTQNAEINTQIAEMLQHNIIENSKSPYASPALLVKKKDASWRFCIDFRSLNAITLEDNFPLPRIESMLDKLGQAKFFSVLDLASGYWQVPIKQSDRYKTAFIVPEGTYQFTVMPFGVRNAPALFTRLMSDVLKPVEKFSMSYIDDIIIYSRTVEDHIDHIVSVLKALESANLKIKPSKCTLFRHSLKFLGHLITKAGIFPDPDKVEEIDKIKGPTTVKEVQSFLGITNFYRKFIPHFTNIARSLVFLTMKKNRNVKFDWTPDCQNAFDTLKQKLKSAPVLLTPDFEREFYLTTDASDYGVGAVLQQKDDEGSLHPISYYSKTMSLNHLNYSTTEKEALAVVMALKFFRPYLYGTPFTIQSDHRPLQWILGSKFLTGRLARWAIVLGEFSIRGITYIPGKTNVVADFLSRNCMTITTHIQDNMNQMQEIQHKDSTLSVIFAILNNQDITDTQLHSVKVFINYLPTFFIKNDLLYSTSSDKNKRDIDHARLVVPQSLRQEILHSCHGELASGHFGFAKTYELVAAQYFWPTMAQDIRLFVTSCLDCATAKPSPTSTSYLKPIVTTYPWQVVSTDILGPFNVTKRGHKYIITFNCLFTKFVEAIAICDGSAETTARVFVDTILSKYGPVESLLSDQGSNYMSKHMDEVLKLTSTSRLRTTAYHPQSNGQAERINRTLAAQLRIFVNEFADDWDQYLQPLMYAIRSVPNSSTKLSPYECIFGNAPKSWYGSHFFQDPAYFSTNDYVVGLRRTLTANWTMVSDNLDRARQMQKIYHDRRVLRKPTAFQIGDWVLKRTTPKTLTDETTTKLNMKYEGPFCVIACPSSSVVTILEPNTIKKETVSIERLKLFVDINDIKFSVLRPDLSKLTIANYAKNTDKHAPKQEYEVERILDSRSTTDRKKRKIKYYLVKWKGYDDTHNSWVHERDLFSPRLLDEYEQSLISRVRVISPCIQKTRPSKLTSLQFSLLTMLFVMLSLLPLASLKFLDLQARDIQNIFGKENKSSLPLVFCRKQDHFYMAALPTPCSTIPCLKDFDNHTNILHVFVYRKQNFIKLSGCICHRIRKTCSYTRYFFGAQSFDCTETSLPLTPHACRAWCIYHTSIDGKLQNVTYIHRSTNNILVPQYKWPLTTVVTVSNSYTFTETLVFHKYHWWKNNSMILSHHGPHSDCQISQNFCYLSDNKLAVWTNRQCEYELVTKTLCTLLEYRYFCTHMDFTVYGSFNHLYATKHKKIICSTVSVIPTVQGLYLHVVDSHTSTDFKYKLNNVIRLNQHKSLNTLVAELQHISDTNVIAFKEVNCYRKYLRCELQNEVWSLQLLTLTSQPTYHEVTHSLRKKIGLFIYVKPCKLITAYQILKQSCRLEVRFSAFVMHNRQLLIGYIRPYTNLISMHRPRNCTQTFIRLSNYFVDVSTSTIIKLTHHDSVPPPQLPDIKFETFNALRGDLDDDFSWDVSGSESILRQLEINTIDTRTKLQALSSIQRFWNKITNPWNILAVCFPLILIFALVILVMTFGFKLIWTTFITFLTCRPCYQFYIKFRPPVVSDTVNDVPENIELQIVTTPLPTEPLIESTQCLAMSSLMPTLYPSLV